MIVHVNFLHIFVKLNFLLKNGIWLAGVQYHTEDLCRSEVYARKPKVKKYVFS